MRVGQAPRAVLVCDFSAVFLAIVQHFRTGIDHRWRPLHDSPYDTISLLSLYKLHVVRRNKCQRSKRKHHALEGGEAHLQQRFSRTARGGLAAADNLASEN